MRNPSGRIADNARCDQFSKPEDFKRWNCLRLGADRKPSSRKKKRGIAAHGKKKNGVSAGKPDVINSCQATTPKWVAAPAPVWADR